VRELIVKYLLLVYVDEKLLNEMPSTEFDSEMRHCLERADDLKREGTMIDFQQLEPVQTAKTVRMRNGKMKTVDGPFAEAKEVLGGFNLIEADSMEEAVKIAEGFPWVRIGSIEVRPVRDISAVRKRVGAEEAARV
jgi:hypothetical protein